MASPRPTSCAPRSRAISRCRGSDPGIRGRRNRHREPAPAERAAAAARSRVSPPSSAGAAANRSTAASASATSPSAPRSSSVSTTTKEKLAKAFGLDQLALVELPGIEPVSECWSLSQTCAELRNDIDCDSPELTSVDTGCAQNVPSQSSRLTAHVMWDASHPTVGAADGSTPRRAEYSTDASLYRVALEVFVANRLGHNRVRFRSAPWKAKYSLGDDVALDFRGAARDGASKA